MKNLNWCGYEWEVAMEGGMLLHPDYPFRWYDKSCAIINDDNVLELTIKKNPKEIKDWAGVTYNPEYGVGLIRSVQPFMYGTFSADIKLPEGENLWPAFWLTGENSWPPEIDMMEGWSKKNGGYFNLTKLKYNVTTNVHYRENPTEKKKSVGLERVPLKVMRKTPDDHWYNYKVIWKPNEIIFYVDNKKIRTIGEKVAKYLANEQMDVVFDLWTETPNFKLNKNMLIRNFKHEQL